MTDKNEAIKGEVLESAVAGRVRLEHYKGQGHIVTFRGVKEIFWVDYADLKKAMEKFDEIVNVRTKKADGKVKITTTEKKKRK